MIAGLGAGPPGLGHSPPRGRRRLYTAGLAVRGCARRRKRSLSESRPARCGSFVIASLASFRLTQTCSEPANFGHWRIRVDRRIDTARRA